MAWLRPGWITEQNVRVERCLVLRVLWAIWHLPLFFMAGTFQNGQIGFGTLQFWVFNADIITGSILYTWIYNNTHRSTLSAILFHFSGNFTGEFLDLSQDVRVWQGIFITPLSVMVVVFFGPKKLMITEGNN